jgi:hypothetical protein
MPGRPSPHSGDLGVIPDFYGKGAAYFLLWRYFCKNNGKSVDFSDHSHKMPLKRARF